MMSRVFVSVLAVVLAVPGPSDARENDLESWYTYWGLGYASNTYPDQLQDVLDGLEDVPGVSVDHLPFALDILGFYWPRGDRTLLGGIVNGTADTYRIRNQSAGSEGELDIYNYLYGMSAMRFLTHEIGQGPFLRADLGLARHVATGEGDEEESDWGTGILLGGGYGIPVTSGTRVLLNANFALRFVEGEQTSSLVLSLNGLF